MSGKISATSIRGRIEIFISQFGNSKFEKRKAGLTAETQTTQSPEGRESRRSKREPCCAQDGGLSCGVKKKPNALRMTHNRVSVPNVM